MSTAPEKFTNNVAFGPKDHCWEWLGSKASGGYGQLRLNGKTVSSHRLSYEVYKGAIPHGEVVRHTCDNPACVNPDHLITGTYSDNTQDALVRGRWNPPKGERNGQAKLNDDTVRYFKRVHVPYHKEFGSSALGRKFGVSGSIVSKIILGQRWGHLE